MPRQRRNRRRPPQREADPEPTTETLAPEELEPRPEVGSWYEDVRSRRFEVTAVDEEAGTIGVQFFNGEAGSLDRRAWEDMVLELIAAPEESAPEVPGAHDYEVVESDPGFDPAAVETPEDLETGSRVDERDT